MLMSCPKSGRVLQSLQVTYKLCAQHEKIRCAHTQVSIPFLVTCQAAVWLEWWLQSASTAICVSLLGAVLEELNATAPLDASTRHQAAGSQITLLLMAAAFADGYLTYSDMQRPGHWNLAME